MSTYIIGDIHGCYTELRLLLDKVKFDNIQDYLWVTGDVSLRGESTLNVLNFLYTIKNSIKLILGNNDLNLIKLYFGLKKVKNSDFVYDLFKFSKMDDLIFWLQSCPYVHIDFDKRIVMSHAGIPFFWTIQELIYYHDLVISFFSSNINYIEFLSDSFFYNHERNYWNNNLSIKNKVRFIINALTRMRFCYGNGDLNLFCKDTIEAKRKGLFPWFSFSNKIIKENYTIIFGHWSNIIQKNIPKNMICLDTGCCWGKELTMIRWEDKRVFKQKKIYL